MKFLAVKAFFVAAARANCLLDHGDLLSITSYDEYNHVKELLRPLRLKTYAFWIGLNSRDLKEVFTWSDGSALTTVQWHSGNPTSLRYNSGTVFSDLPFCYGRNMNETFLQWLVSCI